MQVLGCNDKVSIPLMGSYLLLILPIGWKRDRKWVCWCKEWRSTWQDSEMNYCMGLLLNILWGEQQITVIELTLVVFFCTYIIFVSAQKQYSRGINITCWQMMTLWRGIQINMELMLLVTEKTKCEAVFACVMDQYYF